MAGRKMDSEAANFWEVWIKAIGTFLTVMTLLFVVYQFTWTANDNARKERESRIEQANLAAGANLNAAKMQAVTRYWEKRLEVYGKISQAVGSIAETAPDSPEFATAKKQFLSLYWGEAVLTEDAATEKAMIGLRAYLQIWEPSDPESRNTLKSKCLAVTKSLRASVERARSTGSLAD